MPAKPKTKRTAKPVAARLTHGPHARTVEQNLSHLILNIQVVVPGMLDTDDLFRRWIITYLFEHYRSDVLDGLAADRKRVEAAHA